MTEIEQMTTEPETKGQGNQWWLVAGIILMLPGLPLFVGFVCLGFGAILDGDHFLYSTGLLSFLLMLMTLGCGFYLVWTNLSSRQAAAARPLRLWPTWWLVAGFGLMMLIGLVTATDYLFGVLFPPTLVIAAALPPLAAVSWFFSQRPVELTRRRGLAAFIGGATIGVVGAIILEILLPVAILSLVFDLAALVTTQLETLFEALAGGRVAEAITSRGFISVFVGVAIIAPLAEELTKPLIMLLWARRLSRQEAFMMGALAGAGFAALENVLYAGFGFYLWGGILLVRAIGGAIHPLGSGLMGLAWRDLFQGEANAGRNWLLRFGMATGMHALWNGGILLVITLGSAQFFGQMPPEIDILGLSTAGTTLALLAVLGAGALWLGRAMIQQLSSDSEQPPAEPATFVISDRAAAIWALACLAAIVPAGITGLQLLVG